MLTTKEISFHENGEILQIANLVKNKRHGTVLVFYSNGVLKGKYNLKNDSIYIGDNYEYHDNGMLSNYKYFTNKGELAYIRRYTKQGEFNKEEGVFIFADEYYKRKDECFLSVITVRPPDAELKAKLTLFDKSDTPVFDTAWINKRNVTFTKKDSSIVKFIMDVKLFDGDSISRNQFTGFFEK